MLLVSWNVAGLKPALQHIHSDYGANSSSSSSSSSSNDLQQKSNTANKKSFDPFANYLRLHGDIDILCIQEHKIPLTQLSGSAEPFRCSSIEGYESFWSCATDTKSRGFNGVVTYAKRGLVQAADSTPFKDPELDNQGRCVMTDHGKVVIFNVYVPCGNGPGKMKFLHALREAMDRQRNNGGKHVILMGDMNLKIDKRDVYWLERVLNVNQIIDEVVEQDERNGLPLWKRQIAEKWSIIDTSLKTIEVRTRVRNIPHFILFSEIVS
jgi:exonuclease III